jgi:hypothetical protein
LQLLKFLDFMGSNILDDLLPCRAELAWLVCGIDSVTERGSLIVYRCSAIDWAARSSLL